MDAGFAKRRSCTARIIIDGVTQFAPPCRAIPHWKFSWKSRLCGGVIVRHRHLFGYLHRIHEPPAHVLASILVNSGALCAGPDNPIANRGFSSYSWLANHESADPFK